MPNNVLFEYAEFAKYAYKQVTTTVKEKVPEIKNQIIEKLKKKDEKDDQVPEPSFETSSQED